MMLAPLPDESRGTVTMRCQLCLKSGMSGNNVSHSNRHTKTRFKANVHKQTLDRGRHADNGQDMQPLPALPAQVPEGAQGFRRAQVGLARRLPPVWTRP